jgi:hypothetical protein
LSEDWRTRKSPNVVSCTRGVSLRHIQLQRSETPHACDKVIVSLAINLALSHCGLSSRAKFIILKVKVKDLEDLQLEVDVARRLRLAAILHIYSTLP